MRALALLLIALAAVLSTACGGHGVAGDYSELIIRSSSTGATLCSTSSPGTVELTVLGQEQVRVFLVQHVSGQEHEFDVTDTADFNFSNTRVAASTETGILVGLEKGYTRLVVKYRHSNFTDDDKADLTIIVR